jgi:hypothetical protein
VDTAFLLYTVFLLLLLFLLETTTMSIGSFNTNYIIFRIVLNASNLFVQYWEVSILTPKSTRAELSDLFIIGLWRSQIQQYHSEQENVDTPKLTELPMGLNKNNSLQHIQRPSTATCIASSQLPWDRYPLTSPAHSSGWQQCGGIYMGKALMKFWQKWKQESPYHTSDLCSFGRLGSLLQMVIISTQTSTISVSGEHLGVSLLKTGAPKSAKYLMNSGA